MKEIESINLVLENCEVIKINKEYLGTFGLTDIKRSIQKHRNHAMELLRATEAYIQICSKANVMSSYVTEWSDECLPFTRLTEHRDLVSIRIYYEDGTEEYIYVDWGGDSDYINEHQTVKINENTGDLYIVVSEKLNVESYFSYRLEEKDSSYWRIYSE